MYGKCQAVWFIWPFGGMTKDLSLKCIMYILLLYGFLSSPFDCSAYDRSGSACFIFLWWFFILRNLLEAVCKCSLLCIAKVCLFLTSQSENLHQNITWLQRTIMFSLVCIRGQCTFMTASTFISKIQLIPSWKSRPNLLHVFAKLQLGLEPSEKKVFRWAWLLNFRWNRSPKKRHGLSLSGANWLKANLGIVMLL